MALYAKGNLRAAGKEPTELRENMSKADILLKQYWVNQKEKVHEATEATLKSEL
jgi:hypothetical protein